MSVRCKKYRLDNRLHLFIVDKSLGATQSRTSGLKAILAARVPTGRLAPPGLSNGPGGAASMLRPSVSNMVRRGLAWRGLTWLIPAEVRGLAGRSESLANRSEESG